MAGFEGIICSSTNSLILNLSMLNVKEGLIFKEKKNDSELNLSPNPTDKTSQRQAADAPTKTNLSRI